MKKNFLLFLFTATGYICHSQQQDSLIVTVSHAEEIFLKKNLLLLSEQYNISAAKAQEIQAKLYNNPVFSTEFATYGDNRKWFDIGQRGQKSFSIDQLITLAGKRNKRVLLAKELTNQAGFIFYELMRTLKYELKQNFYSLAYANDLVEKYDDQMGLLQKIISSYDEQAVKRNVPLKDAVRLKSEYIQLSADRNAVVMESIAAQQVLQVLLDTSAKIIPVKELWVLAKNLPPPDSIYEQAKQNRTDLQLQESQVKQEQLNYNYQKALAIPDLNIGVGYDQNGSYISNFYSLRAGIELPFFNRNQGNIKTAKEHLKSAGLARDYKQNEIKKEVMASLSKLEEAEREYRLSQQSFNKDFPEVNKSVIENFNKGNISILEFMDFFQNYNSAIRQINQFQKQLWLTWEELEFTVGGSIDK